MYTIRLLILLEDMDYAMALGKAIALKKLSYSVTVSSFDELLLAEAFLKMENNQYDILLLDGEPGDMTDCGSTPLYIKALYLTEDIGRKNKKGYIYKYGGLENICSEIQNTYRELSGKNPSFFYDNNVKFIGFTSNAGGVGTSSLAIATGREFSSLMSRDILYLSFEDIDSTALYIPSDGGKSTINEYLYYFFTKEKDVLNTEGYVVKDNYGLWSFRPSKGPNQLPGLDPDQLLRFLQSISSNNKYSYVFLDFHGQANAYTELLMQCCQLVLLIDDGRPLSRWKNRKLLENISHERKDDIQNKTVAITNKWQNSADEYGTSDDNKLFIEYDDESFIREDGFIDINLHRRFGIGIRRIADELAAKI